MLEMRKIHFYIYFSISCFDTFDFFFLLKRLEEVNSNLRCIFTRIIHVVIVCDSSHKNINV